MAVRFRDENLVGGIGPAGFLGRGIKAPLWDNARPFCPDRKPFPVNFAEIAAFVGRHPWLCIAFAGLTLALLWTEVMRLVRGGQRLAPAALTALVNREDALVLDLRAAGDFEKGHIPGARHLPLAQVEPTHKLLAGAAKSRPMVLVCRSGQSATGAAARLRKAGFERVYVLDGGNDGWQQAGLPLAKGR
jgi:rhodanese-related sulfurtransferase